MGDSIYIDRPMNEIEKSIYKRALSMYEKAEDCFGPGMPGVNFVAVYILEQPRLCYFEKDLSVWISLSPRSREGEDQLVYQLSHEVCHLLHPTMNFKTGVIEPATILNEGLSTYFSIEMTSEYYDKNILIEGAKTYSPNYYEACLVVEEIMKIDPYLIKKMRIIQPKIDYILPEHFRIANAIVPESLITKALSTFKY